jgi:integrase
MIIITPAELENLVSAMHGPHDLITLTYAGIRWGEMAAIRVRDLNAEAGTIHVSQSLAEVGGDLVFDTTKTHRDRVVGVPTFLIDRLVIRADGLAPDALLFTTRTGRPLRLSNWHSQVWRPAVKASGSPPALRPHDLRHFCASILIRSGASPVLVARQLGHSSPRVTLDVYSHLFPHELDGIAQRLDLVRHDAIATHARHAD